MRMTHPSLPSARTQAGFTLIEVLVSLLILSVLAATAWKGVDSISTARQVTDDNLQQTLRLQSVVTQLGADLDQIVDNKVVDGMQFDGAHLRIVRRSPQGVGVVVVTWYVNGNRLYRWTSPPTGKVGELQKFWLSSFLLQGREPNTLLALKGVERWQVYCFRKGSMSNCQSTGNLTQRPAPSGGPNPNQNPISPPVPNPGSTATFDLPEAVRCQLTLGEGSGFTGTLTRDLRTAP